jgi:hypothetical protein
MSGEKKRLEQFLLQSRASNIMTVDPRYNRFQPDNIDRIRLLQAQRLAGQVPVSERLKKEQKKRKKKARRTKQLRGDLARNLTEQRRFVKGERRDKDTEEPRIVGDPKPLPMGAAYDPEIERRKLDIQQATIDQNRLDRITDRAEDRRRFDVDLAVRRGELAGAAADRRLIRDAIPPPAAPIVIPPAAAPVVNIAAPPPAQVRVEAPQVRVDGPTINVPPAAAPPAAALPARADADPIPEIIRLGDRLRGDYNAFGQEQDARNREVLGDFRQQIDLQDRQNRETLEVIDARQQAHDENLRQELLRNDARFQQIEERLGAGERALGEGRDQVLEELRAAEGRLTGAQRDLDRPTGYDDIIIEQLDSAVREGLEAGTPEALRVSPEGFRFDAAPLASTTLRPIGEAVTPTPRSRFEEVETPEVGTPSLARPSTPVTPPAEGTFGEEQVGVVEGGGELGLPAVLVGGSEEQQEEERFRLSPVEQDRVYPRGTAGGGPTRGGGGALRQSADDRAIEALRLGRAAIEEAEPVLQEEEQEERLRLTTTQDFLSGFDRPASPVSRSPASSEEFLPGQSVSSYVSPSQGAPDRVIEPAGIQALEPQPEPASEARGQVESEEEEEGDIQDSAQQRLRESSQLYDSSFSELTSQVRPGPRGARGQRGGLGFRVRNNTDRTLKRVGPGDVVNVIGVEEGEQGGGVYRLDTQTAAGTRVGLDQFGPLVDDGSFLFERGHRHELGGHFDREEYGPPSVEPLLEEVAPEGVGLLQQGAEAVGGAAAGVVGGAGRLAGGLALGAAQGVAEQLPSAGDVGAALGRGAVGAVSGAGRLAAGAVGALVGGGEEIPEGVPPPSIAATLSSDE